MGNLGTVLCFFLASIILFVSSCQKPELLLEPGVLYTDGKPTPPIVLTEDRSSSIFPNVTIQNGTLHFQSSAHLEEFKSFIDTTSNQVLQSWQESIGFYSTWYWYNKALNDISCEDPDSCNIDSIALVYTGKILYQVEGEGEEVSKDILPLFPERALGWLMNVDGKLYVGQTLIKYKDGWFISVTDGDEQKIPQTITSPIADTTTGVFAHNLVQTYIPCPVECAWNLPCPLVRSGNKRGDHRIKEAYLENYN